MSEATTVDPDKMMASLGHVVGDMGSAMSAALVHIGDKLGLFRTLAAHGPLTSVELAERTGTTERYVREWLVNQASGGYILYDAASGRFSMSAEQAEALTNEDSPNFVAGGFQIIAALIKSEPRISAIFQSGEGMCWGEHDAGLFEGTERFFRPSYIGNLVSSWLPAVGGAVEKLEAGAMVADVGCGHGASTIIMAEAFPNSRFFGFDNHGPSIERAKASAEKHGLSDRVTFEVSQASRFGGEGYDLVTFFDCLHDMGDPTGAIAHTSRVMKSDGAAMIVEPMAGERVEENLNPVGRIFSAASVLCCTPNAICSGGPALGTIASDDALRQVVVAGGLSRFHRVTETPFNRVFEARH